MDVVTGNVVTAGIEEKNLAANIKILLATVPAEAVGEIRLRKNSEGPLPITPKLAIGFLTTWMENHGYKDYSFYDIDMSYPDDAEIESFLKRDIPDVVGLSAVVSTSYQQVKRISKIIRKVNPSATIVLGGYLASAATIVLKKTEVDLCVVGDGEIAWIDVLNHLRKNNGFNKSELDTIQGIAFINDSDDLVFTGYGKQIDQKDIPFVNYDTLKKGLNDSGDTIDVYFRDARHSNLFGLDERFSDGTRGEMLAWLFLSKGCVARCTFCQRYTKGYRVFDYDKLNAYLEMLKTDHNVGHILVGDENFGSNRQHSYEIARILTKHNMLWAVAGARCKNVNKEVLEFYKSHNCSSFKFGVESGSQKMLDVMEKRYNVEDLEQAITLCNDIGFLSPLAFMIGMPGEDEHTIMESAQLTARLASDLKVPALLYLAAGEGVAYALPLKGTPLYEWGREMGLYSQSVDEEERFVDSLAGLGAYKRYYINLNGAPMSEVVFWEWLLKLETSRTGRKLMRGKSWNTILVDRFMERTTTSKNNPSFKAAKKLVPFQYVSEFVGNYLVDNVFVDSIPRGIIYPIIKYFLFLEYLIQRYIYREKYPIYKNIVFGSKKRISDKEFTSAEKQLDKSLRSILEKRKSLNKDLSSKKYGQVKKGVYYNDEAEEQLRRGL